MRGLSILLVFGLASCGGATQIRPAPAVRTVTVKEVVPVPCKALAQLGAEPTYPDTDDAIARAASIGELAKLYTKGRLMRVQRLAEYVVAKASCSF